MKTFLSTIFSVMLTAFVLVPTVNANTSTPNVIDHSGRTAADGCHYDRKTGIRHCH